MNINKDYKDIIGTVFLALSIVMLGYMLISPLNHMVVHVDEYFTLSVLNFPITNLPYVISHDVHPPFHYLLLKVITDILTIIGIQFDKVFVCKIASIIPYALILILSVTKIKKEYGYLTAGLFAFSMAVMSEFLAYYSVVRMYSWGMLFLILAFAFLKDVLDKNDTKSWALFTIFSVLTAYTHYFAAIPILCIYVALLVYFIINDRGKLKNWFISAVAGVILFAPWLLSLIHQVTFIGDDYWYPAVFLYVLERGGEHLFAWRYILKTALLFCRLYGHPIECARAEIREGGSCIWCHHFALLLLGIGDRSVVFITPIQSEVVILGIFHLCPCSTERARTLLIRHNRIYGCEIVRSWRNAVKRP